MDGVSKEPRDELDSNFSEYEGMTKSFRTGRLERELQMVQLSASRCSCIAILRISLVSFVAITFFFAYQRVFHRCCLFRYRLSPENFGYTFVESNGGFL
jgi:hypothetical protein